jgi:hypothetical protein
MSAHAAVATGLSVLVKGWQEGQLEHPYDTIIQNKNSLRIATKFKSECTCD